MDWKKNPKITYVPIFHKPDFGRKFKYKRYCAFSSERTIACEIFTSLPYPVLSTYVHWPGILQASTDHSSTSPFFCLHTWKVETTPSKTKGGYYNLFALKQRYHKLYTPHSGTSKFYCHPSEQISDVKYDSSCLFKIWKKAPVHCYKYDFLKPTKREETIIVNDDISDIDHTDVDSDDNCDSSGIDSDDTVIYDSSSYVRSTNSQRSSE